MQTRPSPGAIQLEQKPTLDLCFARNAILHRLLRGCGYGERKVCNPEAETKKGNKEGSVGKQ